MVGRVARGRRGEHRIWPSGACPRLCRTYCDRNSSYPRDAGTPTLTLLGNRQAPEAGQGSPDANSSRRCGHAVGPNSEGIGTNLGRRFSRRSSADVDDRFTLDARPLARALGSATTEAAQGTVAHPDNYTIKPRVLSHRTCENPFPGRGGGEGKRPRNRVGDQPHSPSIRFKLPSTFMNFCSAAWLILRDLFFAASSFSTSANVSPEALGALLGPGRKIERRGGMIWGVGPTRRYGGWGTRRRGSWTG